MGKKVRQGKNLISTVNALHNLNRCLVSDDQDKALGWLKEKSGSGAKAVILEFGSGDKAFTWTIPGKWKLEYGELLDESTKRIIFSTNNHPFHVITGSLPFTGTISYTQLVPHLHFRKDYPRAIPYVMRFYEPKEWGLGLSYNQFKKLNPKHKYRVAIKTAWSDSSLKVLELTVPGKTKEEIHILAHVDHPFQSNDNLSGVAVAFGIYQQLKKTVPHRTLKFIFHSETIGTLAYLSRYKSFENIESAIVLDIVGNSNSFLLQRSFGGNGSIDFAAEYALKKTEPKVRLAKFQELMGSEELTYNDPQINIPAILISTFPYKEYHTNFDTPEIISEKQLEKTKDVIINILGLLDRDFTPVRKFSGPLQRGPLGWFLTDIGTNTQLDLFQYAIDGKRSVLEIAAPLGLDLELALNFASDLRKRNLI